MSSQQCSGWPNAVSYCRIWSLHTVAKCDFVLINVVDDRTQYCRIWSRHTASDCDFFSTYRSLLFLSNLGRTAAECELFSRTNQPEINCNSRLFYFNCCRHTRTMPVRHIYINREIRLTIHHFYDSAVSERIVTSIMNSPKRCLKKSKVALEVKYPCTECGLDSVKDTIECGWKKARITRSKVN